ncbi:glucose-6-phosphate dehydrogenase, partial [bacterium]|nr:glucose-6-phosphate dehydrogenase [bacterium]
MITDVNPLRLGLRIHRVADPCAIIIFGATGDLTQRKLIPALYHLWRQHLLGTGFAIIGAARTPMSHDEFRKSMREAIAEFSEDKPDAVEWENFASMLFYNATDAKDPVSFQRLKELLDQTDRDRGTSGNRLFYLATPPTYYAGVIQALGNAGMNRRAPGSWVRMIVEKPFGRDAKSAQELNQLIHQVFNEEQVYRIDHYLGK